jgi:hypothetical protein
LPRPALAKEAYIYGFSPVDNYRVRYAYFVAGKSQEFKAPGNRLANVLRVYTPENKAVQTHGVLARGKGSLETAPATCQGHPQACLEACLRVWVRRDGRAFSLLYDPGSH